jgi:hypothetical protein
LQNTSWQFGAKKSQFYTKPACHSGKKQSKIKGCQTKHIPVTTLA